MPDLDRKYMGRWKMPNNDYILRRDALFELNSYVSGNDPTLIIAYRVDLCEIIEKIPTADVVEVKHGKWIQTKDGDFACSLCGYIVKGKPMNYPPDGQMMLRTKGHRYCGDCGAKMGVEDDDATK